VERLSVDGLSSLVGSSEAIAGLVDLSLGEGLDHQQVADGIARLAELTVRGNHFMTLDHLCDSTVLLGWADNGHELVVS
jgi:hypothetical protein